MANDMATHVFGDGSFTVKYWPMSQEVFNYHIGPFGSWTNNSKQFIDVADSSVLRPLSMYEQYYRLNGLAPCLASRYKYWRELILKDRDGNYFVHHQKVGLMCVWPRQIWAEDVDEQDILEVILNDEYHSYTVSPKSFQEKWAGKTREQLVQQGLIVVESNIDHDSEDSDIDSDSDNDSDGDSDTPRSPGSPNRTYLTHP